MYIVHVLILRCNDKSLTLAEPFKRSVCRMLANCRRRETQ